MNLDQDLDTILSDWTTCTTDDNQTDEQYGNVWRSVPAIVLELKALRLGGRERAAIDVRHRSNLANLDRIEGGLSEMVFDIEGLTAKRVDREWVLARIATFFEPARGSDHP